MRVVENPTEKSGKSEKAPEGQQQPQAQPKPADKSQQQQPQAQPKQPEKPQQQQPQAQTGPKPNANSNYPGQGQRQKAPAPQSPVPKEQKQRPKENLTSGDVENGEFTCRELVDLALCTPEVGAVNFNILRILLRDMLEKTGIDNTTVQVDDLEAHQVKNYKSYVKGNAVASPMPGVLRIGQRQGGPQGGQREGDYYEEGAQQWQGGKPRQSRSRHGVNQQQGEHHYHHHHHQEGREEDESQQSGAWQGQGGSSQPQQSGARQGQGGSSQPQQSGTRQGQGGSSQPQQSGTRQGQGGSSEPQQYEGKQGQGGSSQQSGGRQGQGGSSQPQQSGGRQGQGGSSQPQQSGGRQGQGGSSQPQQSGGRQGGTNEEAGVKQGRSQQGEHHHHHQEGRQEAEPRQGRSPQKGGQSDQQQDSSQPQQLPPSGASTPRAPKKQVGITVHTHEENRQSTSSGSEPEELDHRVKKLEKVLSTLNTEPSNLELLQNAAASGPRASTMSVKDAWQLIQLNNRISAAEAAIQKIASIIEDMAKSTGKVKGDMKNLKKDTDELVATSSDLQLQNLDKADQLAATLAILQKDLNEVKHAWKSDRDNMEKVLGVDLGRIPSGMKVKDKEVELKIPPTGKEASGTKTPSSPKDQDQTTAGKQGRTSKSLRKSKFVGADEIAKMTPDEIRQMADDEEIAIPPAQFKELTAEQQKAVHDVKKKHHDIAAKKKKSLGVSKMQQTELEELAPETILEQLTYEEAVNLPPEILMKMKDEQKQMVEKVIKQGPTKSAHSRRELKKLGDTATDDDITKGGKDTEGETSKDGMEAEGETTKEGREAGSGPDPTAEKNKLTKNIETWAAIPWKEIAGKITPEQAASIPQDELQRRFTPHQIEEIERLRDQYDPYQAHLSGESEGESEEEQRDQRDHREKVRIVEPKSQESKEEDSLQATSTPTEDTLDIQDDDADVDDDAKAKESRRKRPERKRRERRTRKEKEEARAADDLARGRPSHRSRKSTKHDLKAYEDYLKGFEPDEETQEHPTPGISVPLTLEEFLAFLTPEDAANLAAEAVQKEIEKQYQHLQGLQRQVADDLQDKIEFIYNKLVKEIANQQLSTTPYEPIITVEPCPGPGICSGHHMPGGVGVCQLKEAVDKALDSAEMSDHVCPGPGVCPGREICPYCIADRQAREALQSLGHETIEEKDGTTTLQKSELEETLLEEMKEIMMLDLEKLREEMKTQQMRAYDERDIMERLSAIWEALKILKHNEEALAIKIARQDIVMRKIPLINLEKLNKIPDDRWEALISGDFGRMGFNSEAARRNTTKIEPNPKVLAESFSGTDQQDIATIMTNLANVIAEVTDQRDRLDQLTDAARILEAGMVTKITLQDAMDAKADLNLMTSKVAYEEFASTVDEIQNQIQNLMLEGLEKNEHWKKVTSSLAADLGEKLDRVELVPIRAFFQGRWKALEEKVKGINELLAQPDPAGTRKKLMKDYNCLSCDRMVNISGRTNSCTLPTIGAERPRSSKTARRALDTHRMRMEKQTQSKKGSEQRVQKRPSTSHEKKSDPLPDSKQFPKDMDIMTVVHRYSNGGFEEASYAYEMEE